MGRYWALRAHHSTHRRGPPLHRAGGYLLGVVLTLPSIKKAESRAKVSGIKLFAPPDQSAALDKPGRVVTWIGEQDHWPAAVMDRHGSAEPALVAGKAHPIFPSGHPLVVSGQAIKSERIPGDLVRTHPHHPRPSG